MSLRGSPAVMALPLCPPGGTSRKLLCAPTDQCPHISSGNKNARKDDGEEDDVAHADTGARKGQDAWVDVLYSFSEVLHLGWLENLGKSLSSWPSQKKRIKFISFFHHKGLIYF